MIDSRVLVLNQNYEPLNVCNARRALVLLHRGKAEVLEHGLGEICTPSLRIPVPSVVRLVYLIKRPRPQGKLTRRDVFARDGYTCQYCGKETRDLTVDHVIPRHKGGKHIWENVVSACKLCNQRKAGRTPLEARMRLVRQPAPPRVTIYYILYPHLQSQYQWQKFIPEWERV